MIKTIAMYLPQFHRIPENDQWWGEGFTEWTSVKNAKKLFDGHAMPRTPLNEFYYDLMEKKTIKWQAELMNRYGVFGMCFYHYYFKDGRKILEKPAENLLKWTDINMPFCFSWANEPWARSWSKLRQKNVWSLENEQSEDVGDGILLEQCYGKVEDWKKHFEYLVPFFKDDRYIKIDGRPVFLIYKSDDIFCLSDMLDVWEELSNENGLKRPYVISTNCRNQICDAQVNMEPQYTIRRFYPDKYKTESNTVTNIIEYEEIVEKSIEIQKKNIEKGRFLSVFPGYDDTPRRSTAGLAIVNSTPSLFKKYCLEMMELSVEIGNEFVFVNAWNEWGETMYLEPDTLFGEEYLKAISDAIKGARNNNKNKQMVIRKDVDIRQLEKTIDQYRSYWKLFESWLTLKEKNKSIKAYLDSRNIKRIAIYGLGMIGNHLITELEGGDIKIEYGIDGKGDAVKEPFPVYTLQDELIQVPLVIVTVTYDYLSIKKKLKKKGLKNIISIEDIIGQLNEE